MDRDLGPNIGVAESIVGSMIAITTALYDTIDDETLPKHLRKIQLRNLLDHLRQLQTALQKDQ